MRGSARLHPRSQPEPPEPPSSPQPTLPVPAAQPGRKKRVLFVCVGNSCRSQMAEALARTYGADVMEPHSAGISPATMIAPMTRKVLMDKNLNIEGQFPKGIDMFARVRFDLIINMSGTPLAAEGVPMVDWPVPDPIGKTEQVYRSVESRIEALVMRLILDLRAAP